MSLIKNFSAALCVLSIVFFAGHADADVTLSAPAAAEIGQPFVITAEAEGEDISDVRIKWQGHEAMLLPQRTPNGTAYSALLGTDIKNAKIGNASFSLSFTSSGHRESIDHTITLTKHEYPSEKLSVEPSKVTPPAELSKKIERETELGRNAMQTNNAGCAPKLPLVRPVPGIFTSVYGKSRYFNGEFRGRHGGADMRAKEGTPVKAAADGTVVLAGENFHFAGNCIYIDHGAGLITFYGHMSKLNVKSGDYVHAGDVIGLSGKTGRVTGPHLHFGAAWRGEFFDPAPLITQ